MRPGVLLRFWACKDILIKLVDNEPKIILDIGGYDGFLLSNVKNENVVGVVLDTDEEGLKKTKERGLNPILGSALKIPCASDSVDIVLLTTPIKDKKLVPFIPKEFMRKLHYNWRHVRGGYYRDELNFLLSKNGFQMIKTETYFNAFSRLMYFILFCLSFPFHRITIKIFELFLKFEPRYKKFGFEHLVLAKVVK